MKWSKLRIKRQVMTMANNWIRISEGCKLPDAYQDVLFLTRYNQIQFGHIWKDGTWSSSYGFELPQEEIIAWCNVPELPSDLEIFI